MPQGAAGLPLEWDSATLIPRATDRNTSQGYYCGWNNKSRPGYPNYWNNTSYSFGAAHRAQVVDDYLSVNNNLTFDQVKDIALNIATTDSLQDPTVSNPLRSWGAGGNLWKFASPYFTSAVNGDLPVPASRAAALALLALWDGHFVDGGAANWTTGNDRADAWMLLDVWIKEVIRLTFEELDFDGDPATPLAEPNMAVLFNVLLHGLRTGGSGITNYYNWFQNADGTAPQTANAIIVKALDNVLATLGGTPWGVGQRGVITYTHDMLGAVYTMPFSSRSTYAHVLEYGAAGPVKIKSMFPLGPSGDIRTDAGGAPVTDVNFFSMTGAYDNFVYRDFPLF
jgi:penicillin amidase